MIIYQKIETFLDTNNIEKKIWIIDENLFKLQKNRILSFLKNDKYFILESIEKNKNMQSYDNIINFLFNNNIDRKYTIIGLGGGIIGDITGFVASTFMRGIKLIHVPTTLLSMVDSSIGGKTGVNNIYGKNMIGSIYQAKNIIIDTTFLNSLPEEHKINGMAEVIKMAIIKGGKLFDLVNSSDPINWDNLEEIIKLSADYKLQIIQDDFNDVNGDRELLNLGHTWGHAYEFSQNILHGFAVAEGMIEEFKYTNYYYGYPSNSIITNITNLLKKWKLLTKPNIYPKKLIYYYLSKDKKSDRLITVKDIGDPSIVTFSIDNWKILKNKYFKLLNNNINVKDQIINVPSSKSITNRSFICGLIYNHDIEINNILKSEDTELMINALRQSNVSLEDRGYNIFLKKSKLEPKGTYYLGNSGTCVRFLLPLFALTTKEEIIIDGSEEMRKRPIGPLVESLNNFGCKIEGGDYLPLKISPVDLNFEENNIIEIDGSKSSQYVTGLLLAFSYLKSLQNINFTINITGEETSCGFIKLTLDMLKQFGVDVLVDDKKYIIDKIENKNEQFKYIIEGDATTASYLFAWSYVNKFKLTLPNLNDISIQPDIKILLNMLPLFGKLLETKENITFEPYDKINIIDNVIDLDSSDTFLTWACLFVLENRQVEITNIENQNWKECNRIDNFISNIELLGGKIERTKTGFKIVDGINNRRSIMKTYNDHRMAMSFSLISLNLKDVYIENPFCVNKTFPDYWKELIKIGVKIIPTNRVFYNNIVLIGMPNNGKTTLGREASDKLNLSFYDTDSLVESDMGLDIPEIIKMYGWDIFRDLEAMQLFNCVENKNEKLENCISIISTGGGIIERKFCRNLLENCLVIWVKRDNCVPTDRSLSDSYHNLEIERRNIYENLADYIYLNNGPIKNFVSWLKLILSVKPIPNKSTFLCKTNTDYESNIANCIELRGDMMDNYGLDDIQKMMINFNRKCIYTLRTENEGGKFNGLNYKDIILRAIKYGAQLVDIEVSYNLEFIENIITIGSIHSNNMNYIDENIKKFNYDILKIVTNEENCQEILFIDNLPNEKIIIDNNTGQYRLNNNFMTPISSINSLATAPNQLNYLEYIRKLGKKVIYLFGNNIGHSPSCFIHNMVISKFHRDVVYLNFESNNIDEIIKLIKMDNFFGASVTMPYKEEIIRKLSISSNELAVNTINSNFQVINTDKLALQYFKKDLPTIILGTGGAAIGAIESCYNMNVTIVGRNVEKLEYLCEKYSTKAIDINIFESPDTPHQIINCLPPNVSIKKFINKNTFLMDMSYGMHNLPDCINGYDILYVQAAYQYNYWFGGSISEILNEYKIAMNKFNNF